MPINPSQLNPRQSLMTLRIMWGAFLFGQLVFLGVVIAVRNTVQPMENARLLAMIAIGMLVVMAPVAVVVRRMTYGRPDADGNITPGKYMVGNIIFLAMFEAPSFFGLIVYMFGEPLGLVTSVIAMAVQALSFPTGSAIGLDKL